MNILAFHLDITKLNENTNSLELNEKKFIIGLKFAELKILCICIDVSKVYEGNEFDKIYEFLSTIKDKK